MKIALTGSTGFLGGYLVPALAAAGHDLRLLVRPGREPAAPPAPGVERELFVGDLVRPESLRGFLDGVQLLIHAASVPEGVSDEELRAVNIGGTEALIEEAKRLHLDRIGSGFQLWVVSSAVIGAPVHSYFRDTKRIQEKLVRGSGIEWASFRPTQIYGRGDLRHTAPFLRQCARPKGTLWVPHSGRSRINPVHVEDVVDAILRFFAFERGVDCCYELAGPAGMPYNEYLDLTIAAVGGGVKRRNISAKWANRLLLLKGLFTDVTADRRAVAYFMMHHQHDIENAATELGWTPRPYAQGIREVAAGDWWRQEEAA